MSLIIHNCLFSICSGLSYPSFLLKRCSTRVGFKLNPNNSLFAPHPYIFVLRAHPVRGESHNQRNTTGEVATLLTDHCFSKAIYEQARSIKGQYPPIFCALKFFSAQKLFYVVCFKHILKTIRFPP